MSPHRIARPNAMGTNELNALLRSFSISKFGFLPAQSPLRKLPHPYYEPWELLAHNLPQLVKAETIRDRIRDLPLLETTQLHKQTEWRRAYVILTFLTHGYIWGGEVAQEVVPPQLSIPLLQVSAHLELPPVATYASLALWNFYLADTNPYTDPSMSSGENTSLSLDNLTADNIYSLNTITETFSESWFYTISIAMEHRGGRVIPTLLSALSVAQCPIPSYNQVKPTLKALTSTIHTVTHLLDRMHDHCDPMTFYHRIRPLLSGSRNATAAGLPRGVFYDEGDGKGEWRSLRGGSNGQSSLLQLFDVVLGVKHKAEGSGGPDGGEKGASFFDEIRTYMPGPHRRFLEYMEGLPNFQELIERLRGTAEGEEMRVAYQQAVKALADLRDRHLSIVARYIVLPSRQPPPEGALRRGLAKTADASAEDQESLQRPERGRRPRQSISLRGTGGTMLMPFLKQTRNETLEAATCRR